MWKKRKDIEGISSSSIVNLKAAVSVAEIESKRAKTSGVKVVKQAKATEELASKSRDLFTGHNKGLEERRKKDEEQHLAEESAQSWDTIKQKLQTKSELYRKMGNSSIFFFSRIIYSLILLCKKNK